MLTSKQIEELYSKRTKTLLTNIISPKQDLTFSQLKIYYKVLVYNALLVNDLLLRYDDETFKFKKYKYYGFY